MRMNGLPCSCTDQHMVTLHGFACPRMGGRSPGSTYFLTRMIYGSRFRQPGKSDLTEFVTVSQEHIKLDGNPCLFGALASQPDTAGDGIRILEVPDPSSGTPPPLPSGTNAGAFIRQCGFLGSAGPAESRSRAAGQP